jgi:hypothetical protein
VAAGEGYGRRRCEKRVVRDHMIGQLQQAQAGYFLVKIQCRSKDRRGGRAALRARSNRLAHNPDFLKLLHRDKAKIVCCPDDGRIKPGPCVIALV